MALTYTEQTIPTGKVYVLKYGPIKYLLLLAIFISLSTDKLATIGTILAVAWFFVVFLELIERRKVYAEIKKEMRERHVKVSGSKFSFKNPVRFEIEKHQS